MTFVDCTIDKHRDSESGVIKYSVTLVYSYLYFYTYKEAETFDTLEEAQKWILEKRCYNKITINDDGNNDDEKKEKIEEFEVISGTPSAAPSGTVTPKEPTEPKEAASKNLLAKPTNSSETIKSQSDLNPHIVQRLYLDKEGLIKAKTVEIPQLKTICGQVVAETATGKKRKRKRKR